MNFDDIKFQFAAELSSPIVNPRSRRYSKELKAAVISAMKAHETSVYEVSKTLGLSATAVYNWISREPTSHREAELKSEELFIPAKLVTSQGDSDRPKALVGLRSVIIHMPAGEKIELNY